MSRAALLWLEDREALRQLMVDYFAGVDERDFDRVAACFTEDIRANYGKLYEGREALIRFISGVSFFDTTLHCMGAQLFSLSEDEAHMVTGAMIAHHGRKGDGEAFEYDNSDGRYIDVLTRRGGRWIVSERGSSPVWPAVGAPAPDTSDPALRWLIDRAEVRDLLAQWAFGMDARDEARVRACVSSDFTQEGAGEALGAGAFVSRVKDLERFESTSHFLGVPAIDLSGDEVIVESCCLVTQRESGEPGRHPVLGLPERDERTESARFRDRLVRSEGRWWLAARGSGVRVLHEHATDPPSTTDAAIRDLIDRELIRDAIARSALALDREDPQSEQTFHLVGNQEIEIRGDEATVRSYVYQTRREQGEESHWGLGPLHWDDRLERKGRAWRIASRTEVDLLAAT